MCAWSVRLSRAAEADVRGILRWTLTRFGEAQVTVYANLLTSTIELLTAGPNAVGAKPRDDIAKGLMALSVARSGHPGRHFILYRVGKRKNEPVIEVLRVLHHSMDLARHFPRRN